MDKGPDNCISNHHASRHYNDYIPIVAPQHAQYLASVPRLALLRATTISSPQAPWWAGPKQFEHQRCPDPGTKKPGILASWTPGCETLNLQCWVTSSSSWERLVAFPVDWSDPAQSFPQRLSKLGLRVWTPGEWFPTLHTDEEQLLFCFSGCVDGLLLHGKAEEQRTKGRETSKINKSLLLHTERNKGLFLGTWVSGPGYLDERERRGERGEGALSPSAVAIPVTALVHSFANDLMSGSFLSCQSVVTARPIHLERLDHVICDDLA